MTRTLPRLLAAALLLGAAACSDGATAPQDGPELETAFNTVPSGFNETANTFSGGDSAWSPAGRRHRGRGHGGGPGGLMGGGLGGLFLGDGLGPHPGQFPWGRAVQAGVCAFDEASGRVVCQPVVRNGLTILRSAAFADAAGSVQRGYDSVTTNTVNARTTVTGTRTRRDGATSTVEHASDRTVTGLARGSTRHTVSGTSAGHETTEGADSLGRFTVVRVVGDSVRSVVIPVESADGTRPYPVAGSIVRSMQVTATYAGQAPASRSRREEIVFDGDDTATLLITVNGVTITCTLPLPHGRPTCP